MILKQLWLYTFSMPEKCLKLAFPFFFTSPLSPFRWILALAWLGCPWTFAKKGAQNTPLTLWSLRLDFLGSHKWHWQNLYKYWINYFFFTLINISTNTNTYEKNSIDMFMIIYRPLSLRSVIKFLALKTKHHIFIYTHKIFCLPSRFRRTHLYLSP